MNKDKFMKPRPVEMPSCSTPGLAELARRLGAAYPELSPEAIRRITELIACQGDT